MEIEITAIPIKPFMTCLYRRLRTRIRSTATVRTNSPYPTEKTSDPSNPISPFTMRMVPPKHTPITSAAEKTISSVVAMVIYGFRAFLLR